MSTLGMRLAGERKRLNLNQQEFGSVGGISKQTQSLYETDKRSPDADYLALIHKGGADITYILTGERLNQASMINDDEFVYIERLSVEASAGAGATVDDETSIGKAAFRKEWIQQRGLDAKRLCILKVKGDSMSPTLEDGDAVLVETFLRHIDNNIELGCDPQTIKRDGVYVLRIDGHLVIKRLQRDMRGGFIVKSDNPSYSDIQISADSVDDFCVAGRVEWAGGNV